MTPDPARVTPIPGTKRDCPDCPNIVSVAAAYCSHCGHELDEDLARPVIETEAVATAVRAARYLKARTIGLGFFDPAYPFHGALHECPFCGCDYRVHGGHADHRDNCEDGPSPGSNPAGPPGGDEA